MKIAIPDIVVPVIRLIRTKEEKDLLREQIVQLERGLFTSDSQGLETRLKKYVPEHIAAAIDRIISLPSLKDSPEELKIFFQKLRAVVDELPVLNIDLAFKPTEVMIDRLHEWVRESIGIGIVLDMGYDASILGGSRLIFAGRYREATLTQMVTDALAQEKTNILKLIR